MKELVKSESKLAHLTGYNVKIVEKSGTQLVRLFQRVHTPTQCHWDGCPACRYVDSNSKSSKCRINNVVYEAVCLECEEEATRNEYNNNGQPVVI